MHDISRFCKELLRCIVKLAFANYWTTFWSYKNLQFNIFEKGFLQLNNIPWGKLQISKQFFLDFGLGWLNSLVIIHSLHIKNMIMN